MLILPIKKKWLDMIISGEKKEEYREIKPYYTARFRNYWGDPVYWNEPHRVMFRNGYSKESPAVITDCTLSIKSGNPAWGAEPGKKYYVLSVLQYIRGNEK